jgi:hypothetical protein
MMEGGMINSRMGPEKDQLASTQTSPGDGESESDLSNQDTEQASEQQLAIEEAGKTILYDDKSNQAILKNLQGGAEDPYRVVAQTAFMLVVDLDKRSGGKLPEEDLVPAAITIMNEIALIATMSGSVELPGVTMGEYVEGASDEENENQGKPIIEEEVQSKLIQNLVVLALENGVISPEQIQELANDMGDEELQAIIAQQEQIAGGQQGPAPVSPQEQAPPQQEQIAGTQPQGAMNG